MPGAAFHMIDNAQYRGAEDNIHSASALGWFARAANLLLLLRCSCTTFGLFNAAFAHNMAAGRPTDVAGAELPRFLSEISATATPWTKGQSRWNRSVHTYRRSSPACLKGSKHKTVSKSLFPLTTRNPNTRTIPAPRRPNAA